jgi:hypothetical protein
MTRRLVFALLASATLLGCPSLGGDDYAFDEPDASAGSGGSSAGASGAGASGGTGATAGAGTGATGGAGTGGTAGAGTGGTGGAGTGATGGAGTGATGGASGAAGTGGTGGGCTTTLPQPACPATKPSVCTFCQDGSCNLICTGTSCQTTITCPPGLVCNISCVGNAICDTAIIDCTQAAGCAVTCDGDHACRDAQIKCGSGPCLLTCKSHDHACGEKTLLSCGNDYCGVTCEGGVKGPAASDISCTASPCNGCPTSC